ncbi:cyclophane-forming radical SAM/SPASM peptide maturase GrrM/OscB [Methylomonas rhizoryzae]|uniref:cyclophane-forming radical SAM/SPASM peptide maturase GrrM/OscB n=1 Tax=Methylomonas rhizoryzae TaxID=2608981 RepID=UPI00123259A9|nr:cyclophane-forming radical SAM/SPASM peptide maturase GrrM/OscB [Methylomonas rhizoryzae]
MKTWLNHWMAGTAERENRAMPAGPFVLADFTPRPATQLLILQPTPFCNLDCDYCYLPQRDSRARMSLDTVKLAAQRVLEDGLLGPELTVVWHAGEPLAVPVDFYRQAFGIFDQLLSGRCRVSHSIQTNATLIDAHWCELFSQHRVRVGVSVDGPAAINDSHRKTRQGKGSFAQVQRGMAALRHHGVPFHVIAVVTADSLPHARLLHDFVLEQGIGEIGFNFDEAEGTHADSSLRGREAEHRRFFEQLLALQLQSADRYRVRELANALSLIQHGLPRYCWRGRDWPMNAQTLPFAIVTVAWNGDFSTFSPELLGQPAAEFDNFVLGNVHCGGFLQAAERPAFARLWEGILAGTAVCRRSCGYFNYCGGGAPANKWFENGGLDSGETLYCRSMLIRPFETVLQALEREAAGQAGSGEQL